MSTTKNNSTPILFFDGVCAMCNTTVNMIMRHDTSGKILFAPLQGQTAVEKLGAEQAALLNSMVMMDESGTWRKSTAVCRLLFKLGIAWKLLGALLWIIPYPIRDLGYSLVAKYRYRMFGKNETCRLPSAEERTRFLD